MRTSIAGLVEQNFWSANSKKFTLDRLQQCHQPDGEPTVPQILGADPLEISLVVYLLVQQHLYVQAGEPLCQVQVRSKTLLDAL